MTDVSQGEGWWQASDTKWYPPHLKPEPVLLPPPPQDEVPSDHEAAPIEVPSVTVAASAPISTLSNAQAQSPTLSPTTPRRWRRSKALWAGAAVAVVAAVVIAAVALVPSHNGANTSAKASNASSLATWSTGRKVLNFPWVGGPSRVRQPISVWRSAATMLTSTRVEHGQAESGLTTTPMHHCSPVSYT